MTLGAPLGLLALTALGPLVAAYFLRRKQPPRTVSALFLWQSPDQRAEAGPRLKRFSREWSLAFEIVALLAATAFLADLRFGHQAASRPLTIVIDGGLSMRARVGGTPVFERVKTAVAQRAEREHANALTILESGVRPTVLAGPQLETSRALTRLNDWSPSQPAHEVLSALTLARELSTAETPVVFFTDGPPGENVSLPAGVEVVSLGTALPNVAIVAAQRRDEGGLATVTVRVTNFSDEKKSLELTFEAAGAPTQTQPLSLAPQSSGMVRLTLKTEADITVRLPDDALPEDSVVTLAPSPLPEVSVAMLDTLAPAAQQSLKRFLAVAPGVTQRTPALLTFGPPGSEAQVTLGAEGTTRSFVGPFFALKTHPVLDDVQLGGAVWAAGANPPGHSLMSAGDAVLLSEEDDGRLHLNLEVAKSNVQKTVAWPVLLSNVVRQARLHREGFARRHLMLGEEVPVSVNSAAKWQVRTADGVVKPLLGSGPLTLPAPAQPGRLELLKDGAVVDVAMVLPIEPRESDLQTRGAYSNAAVTPAGPTENRHEAPRSLWPVALMMACLMVSLMLTARRPA